MNSSRCSSEIIYYQVLWKLLRQAAIYCVYGTRPLLTRHELLILTAVLSNVNKVMFDLEAKGIKMSVEKSSPVCVIPRMPAEFIACESLLEIAPGFALYKLSQRSPGCIMRVGNDPLTNIGDWMGYIAWLMDQEEKDEDQVQAEKIMRREVLALHTLTMTDKLTLSAFDVDVEAYKEYKDEVNDHR